MLWEDLGLYLSLFISAIVMIPAVIAYVIVHRMKKLARFLRPNRPGSSFGSILVALKLFPLRDEVTLAKWVGLRPALSALETKYLMRIVLLSLIPAIAACCITATDNYNNIEAQINDPANCRNKKKSQCSDASLYCSFLYPTCQPRDRRGLFDLSLANVNPDSTWRLWVLSILSLIIAVFFTIEVIRWSKETKRLIWPSWTKTWNDAIIHPPVTSLAMRTVCIRRLPKDSKKIRDFLESKFSVMFTSAEDFSVSETLPQSQSSRSATLSHHSSERSPASHPSSKKGATVSSSQLQTSDGKNSSSTSDQCVVRSHSVGPKHPSSKGTHTPTESENERPLETSDSSSTTTEKELKKLGAIDPNSVFSCRKIPKNLSGLVTKYPKLLDRLRNSVAKEKKQMNPNKKPVKKKKSCCRCKKYPAVDLDLANIMKAHSLLRPLLRKRDNAPYTGNVFVTFAKASDAMAYGRKPHTHAHVMGPAHTIIYKNVLSPPSIPVRVLRYTLSVIFFAAIVIFSGTVVGFLGTLDSLVGLPSIGKPLSKVLSLLGKTVTGIIRSYLPIIISSVFQFLLPIMLLAIAELSGAKTLFIRESLFFILEYLYLYLSYVIIMPITGGSVHELWAISKGLSAASLFKIFVKIPNGSAGYWVNKIILGTAIANALAMLVVKPFFFKILLGGKPATQARYNAGLRQRQTVLMLIIKGICAYYASVAMLMHITTPIVVVSCAFFLVITYIIQTALTLDSGDFDRFQVIDFSLISTTISTFCFATNFGFLMTLCAMLQKKAYGEAGVIGVGALLTIGAHIYVRWSLHYVLNPKISQIRTWEKDFENHGENAYEKIPPTGSFYPPPAARFQLDETVVEEILEEYQVVDKTLTKEWTSLPKRNYELPDHLGRKVAMGLIP